MKFGGCFGILGILMFYHNNMCVWDVCGLFANAGVLYLDSNAGNPWGQTTNEDAMDGVFGAGKSMTLRALTTLLVDLSRMKGICFRRLGPTNHVPKAPKAQKPRGACTPKPAYCVTDAYRYSCACTYPLVLQ